MTDLTKDRPMEQRLADLGMKILDGLAGQFPVCMSSDEFHFFPQYRPARPKWSQWDDFSTAGLRSFLADIQKWRQQLQQKHAGPLGADAEVDLEMLARILDTVQEQLEMAAPHASQPTFFLAIAAIGLAEALEESFAAFKQRLETLPAFLDTAKENLQRIPTLFQRLGITMAKRLKGWLGQQPLADGMPGLIAKALDDFGAHLNALETVEDFRLPDRVYARIAEHHMGCGMGPEEIGWHLAQEIETTEALLAQTAHRIEPGKPWQAVWQALPPPVVGAEAVAAFYDSAIANLKNHCMAQGLFNPDKIADGGVTVRTIPEHLMLIRANAAYSMPAGHPPKGGTFYVMPRSGQRIPRGVMMLTAHETYPGHHLLDTIRWQLDNPLRRSLEFPIFYEGWACFAEELLFDTELFSGPVDRLLMAKRRYWRAQRGLADLKIHTGQNSLDEAADALCRTGLVAAEQARLMVQRYALKPGYQLAYAIGRGKFRQLYTAYLGRGQTPARFVRKVLAGGEIGFDRLAERLLY